MRLLALVCLAACSGPVRGEVPDLAVLPGEVVLFGRIPVSQQRTAPVTLRNVGRAELRVESVTLGGAAGSPFRLGEEVTPFTLGGGDERVVEVIYAPEIDAVFEDRLVVTSNDPDSPVVEVAIRAIEVGAHLRFEPAIVDFGLVEGRAGPVTVRLLNDGTEPVAITAATLVAGADFGLDADVAGVTLAPGDELTVEVTYDGSQSGAGEGRVVVESNAPAAALDLRGPPVAITGAEVIEEPLIAVTLDGTSSRAPGNAITTWRWSVVEAPEGSQTVAQFDAGEAQVVRDETRCPAGQNGVPQPCFFPDNPGVYRFALVVVDERPSCPLADPGETCGGDADCCSFSCGGTCADPAGEHVCRAGGGCAIESAPAIQVVRAIPDQAVFISLTWDGPGDFDLHLVRDDAAVARAWTSNPDDAYWANPAPDWGVPDATNGQTCTTSAECTTAPYHHCRRPPGAPAGECVDASDDPRLLIDVTDAFGPEAIAMQLPPQDTYHIGVHYFPDEQTAPRRATVRIFVLGMEVFPPGFGPGAPLTAILERNEFWYVGRLTIPAVVASATAESEPLSGSNPSSNADPSNYPAIP